MDSTPTEPPATAGKLHRVSVPGFEGPLDLLLSLIEEEKLDISRVSLASVTGQYLARVRALSQVPPEHLADFLVVAATLLLLKSRRLFPDLPLTEEEEERITSLEGQLQEYRKFREAAKTFQRLWERRLLLRGRERFQGLPPFFAPPPGLTAVGVRAALASVIQHLPRLELLREEVIRRVVSLEERIRDIQQRIAARAAVTFGDVAASAESRLEVIVSFLALLELVKQRVVAAEQRDPFRDILLARRDEAASSA